VYVYVCRRRKTSELTAPSDLAVLSPLVLLLDLGLLLGCEIVDDVEGLADLLGGLALDDVGNGLAADVEEGLDIKVVGGEDDLEEHLLVNLHELHIPLLDVVGALAGVVGLLRDLDRVVAVVLAVLDDLSEDGRGDVGEGNGRVGLSDVLEHVLDEDRALGDLLVNLEVLVV